MRFLIVHRDVHLNRLCSHDPALLFMREGKTHSNVYEPLQRVCELVVVWYRLRTQFLEQDEDTTSTYYVHIYTATTLCSAVRC